MDARPFVKRSQQTHRTVRLLEEEYNRDDNSGAITETKKRRAITVETNIFITESVWMSAPEDSRQARTCLATLTLNIPRFHNPDEAGRRRKVGLRKLKLTVRELRCLFSGYSVAPSSGWCKDDRVRDSHYRFEVDFYATRELLNTLIGWKKALEARFEQRSIYMRISDGVAWL